MIYVLIWRDGPADGKERYVITPQQRGAPTEPGKWVAVGEAALPDAVLEAAFNEVQARLASPNSKLSFHDNYPGPGPDDSLISRVPQ